MAPILLLAFYPFIVAGLMPHIIGKNCFYACYGNYEYKHPKLILFCKIFLALVFYPIWLVLAIIPGYCFVPLIIKLMLYES